MKVSKRGKTLSFRFDNSKKDQSEARVLLNALAGRPLNEPLQGEDKSASEKKGRSK